MIRGSGPGGPVPTGAGSRSPPDPVPAQLPERKNHLFSPWM